MTPAASSISCRVESEFRARTSALSSRRAAAKIFRVRVRRLNLEIKFASSKIDHTYYKVELRRSRCPRKTGTRPRDASPISWNARRNDGTLVRWSAIANGSQDTWIRARADAFRAYGSPGRHPRFHHEPENDTGSTVRDGRRLRRGVPTHRDRLPSTRRDQRWVRLEHDGVDVRRALGTQRDGIGTRGTGTWISSEWTATTGTASGLARSGERSARSLHRAERSPWPTANLGSLRSTA